MKNHLKNETSPYLLQHASNPVDWYPWGDEAFERAKAEDKPVFLSIGYSTCHWCHVMAHESFEDEETARILNQSFISIKVDREERPDIDSIYMAVCQAFTGSGGWPTSIFMTPEQKPFFAGTYFPKNSRGRMIGFKDLLTAIGEKWRTERQALTEQAEWIVERLKQPSAETRESDPEIIETAIELYKEVYDPKYGGFGSAPKFPTPHNILFLLAYYERSRDDRCLKMAEHTLEQMYRGGLFDHIGYGFCRYSTDERFLVPHFEKMLYDNALLIMAYSKAYAVTKREFYLKAAQKTAEFVLREMTSPEGGFYTAQDADSGGEEGKYYLFSPDETIRLLGEKEGAAFNRRFDITAEGNFEGKNIPNLLASDIEDESLEALLPRVREYRRERCSLHLDDKILTAQNSLMTAALCLLYRAGKNEEHLAAAKRAEAFIQKNLCSDDTIFVSFRLGKRGVKGFVDDYAAYIFALLNLYTATLERQYLDRAKAFCAHALKLFKDKQNGGFFLYGKENESLILRPKESYDGAVPSGNSLMAWNLVRLYQLTYEQEYENEAKQQLEFLSAEAARYPIGYAMFLLSLLDHRDPPPRVTVVAANEAEAAKAARDIPIGAVAGLQEQSDEYKLKDGKTTFYICKNQSCLPPVNDLNDLFGGL